jgi:hypothetical protein
MVLIVGRSLLGVGVGAELAQGSSGVAVQAVGDGRGQADDAMPGTASGSTPHRTVMSI